MAGDGHLFRKGR